MGMGKAAGKERVWRTVGTGTIRKRAGRGGGSGDRGAGASGGKQEEREVIRKLVRGTSQREQRDTDKGRGDKVEGG